MSLVVSSAPSRRDDDLVRFVLLVRHLPGGAEISVCRLGIVQFQLQPLTFCRWARYEINQKAHASGPPSVRTATIRTT